MVGFCYSIEPSCHFVGKEKVKTEKGYEVIEDIASGQFCISHPAPRPLQDYSSIGLMETKIYNLQYLQ
jgi:hypothetical protein